MANFRQGDRAAADNLVELCFPELRRLAAARMKSERTEHTWQPTVLVNVLYLELVKVRSLAGGSGEDELEKAAFLGFAGHLMKRLLIHHARPLYRQVEKVELEARSESSGLGTQCLGDVEEALSRLAAIDPRFRIVVECESSKASPGMKSPYNLGAHLVQLTTYWNFAKRWLQDQWAGASGCE